MVGALRVAIQLSEPRFKPNIHFAPARRGGQGKVSKWIPVDTRAPGEPSEIGIRCAPLHGSGHGHLLQKPMGAMGPRPWMILGVWIEDDKSMRYDFRGYSIEKHRARQRLRLENRLLT